MLVYCFVSEKIKMSTKIKDEFGMILKDHIPSKKEEQAKQKQKATDPLPLNPYGVPTQCMYLLSYVCTHKRVYLLICMYLLIYVCMYS